MICKIFHTGSCSVSYITGQPCRKSGPDAREPRVIAGDIAAPERIVLACDFTKKDTSAVFTHYILFNVNGNRPWNI